MRTFVFTVLCGLLMCGCVDMDKLSDKAGLNAFEVKEVYTTSAELGSVSIVGDTVKIALEHGRYLSEILFSADITLDNDAEKLLNLNPDSISVIDKNNDGMITEADDVLFYLRAKSGLPIEWHLVLVPTASNDNTDIRSAQVSDAPHGFMIGKDAFIYKESDTEKHIKIIAPRCGEFPITLTMNFVMADSKAKLYKADASGHLVACPLQDTLRFGSEREVRKVVVEAEDGKKSEWPVLIAQGQAVYADNEKNFRQDQVRTVNIASPTVIVTNANDNEYWGDYTVDSVANEIVLNMRGAGEDGAVKYPVTLAVGFNLRPNQVCVGYTSGRSITLGGEPMEFYMYDRVGDLKKLWRVRARDYQSSEADVEAFTLTRSTPSDVKFKLSDTEINKETGEITLVVESGLDKFPVILRSTIKVSGHAELIGISSSEDYILNDINSVKEFKVRAEDGTMKDWHIRLRFAGTLNNEARVESFRVTDYKGANGLLQMETQGIINHDDKTVTLTVNSHGKDMPLTFHAAVSISYKASFVGTQYVSSYEWKFNSLDDTRKITVKSEDGLVENVYTVVFNDKSPAASSDAELLNMKATGFASGYTVSDTYVDYSSHVVTFTVTAKGSGSFYFTPQLTLSEGATTEGIISGTRVNFASVKDVKEFYVVSEDGQNRTLWTIRIRYVPQIPNGDMEKWSTDRYSKKVPTGWSSSNNSITTAVKAQSGSVDGSTCAYLETTSVLGNIAGGSIFLGWFKMDLSQLGEPKQMSHFGIPFDAYPAAVTADVKYVSGGSGDLASIEIHMLNYEGSGEIDYHTFGTKDANGIYRADASKEAGITVVGYGRDEFNTTNGWVTKRLPVTWYYDNPLTGYTKDRLPVTHIYVSYCTSYRADYIEGTVGSKMWVDNVRLEYDE